MKNLRIAGAWAGGARIGKPKIGRPGIRRGTYGAIMAAVLLGGIPVSTAAQKPDGGHFRKGVFAGVEISAGMTVGSSMGASGGHLTETSAGMTAEKLMPDYGIGMFGGYRFRPQFAIAAGIEGSNSVVTGTTALPVFVRLRSDILDRRVSPVVQLDLGYAFQFAHSKRTVSELAYNAEAFPERYVPLGFSTPEEYISACIENLLKQYDSLSDEEAGRLADEERERATDRLCSFPNGQRSYLPAEALDELGCFSKDGFFGSLTAGVSIGVGKDAGKGGGRGSGTGAGKGQNRISAGLSVGMAQYSHSIRLRAPDNSFINISVPAVLPDGTRVITARNSVKENPLRVELCIRLCWEF